MKMLIKIWNLSNGQHSNWKIYLIKELLKKIIKLEKKLYILQIMKKNLMSKESLRKQ